MRLLLVLCGVAVAMVGVAYSFVPLYRIFCSVMGIPVPSVLVGEAGTAKSYDPSAVTDRTVLVRFIGNAASGVPVSLAPVVRTLRVRLGEPALTAYAAENTSSLAMDGVAVHTIFAMGGQGGFDINNYIELQQCFCFEEQHYPAHERVNLPLSFIVTPDLPEGVHTITFAYTLFADKDAPKKAN